VQVRGKPIRASSGDDRTRDAPGRTLLTEGEDRVRELLLVEAREQVVRALANVAAHAHVQRPVETQREAPLRPVKLHGGDAEIEESPVDAGLAELVERRVEVRKIPADERDPVGQLRGDRRGWIDVEGDDPPTALHDRASVTSRTIRAVEVQPTRVNRKSVDRFVEKDGYVRTRIRIGILNRARAPS
jgi:hypothetical protein